jgi:catechol 2,3-dioxygenase-like lactoylglutathione lyase family enzyme
MINGLDHLVVLCPSLAQGVPEYERLLGRQCDWIGESHRVSEAGVESAFFQLDNTAVELISPYGNGELAARLRQRIAQNKAGLQSLVFASDDLAEDHRVMARRALLPQEIEAGESSNGEQTREWKRFRLDPRRTAGMRLFVLQRAPQDPLVVKPAAPAVVTGLDHCVITTANPDRAAALYGARLGLRFALDRSNEQRDLRLQWFRAGAATVEVAHKISHGVSLDDDMPMGLTWQVGDIAMAHERLVKAQVEVSEIRDGFKPGTRVFSVRSHTLGVPTLFLHSAS